MKLHQKSFRLDSRKNFFMGGKALEQDSQVIDGVSIPGDIYEMC